MKKLLLSISLGLLVLIPSAISYAQISTATIGGVVRDQTGAVVPDATVRVTQVETNSTFSAKSDAKGVFSLPSLPVGPYRMDVTAQGFGAYQRTGIVLTVGQVANFDLQLQVGSVTQSVDVSSAAPLIEATESTISTTMDQETVTDLPLNGRNPATLVLNAPGVVNATQNVPSGQLAATNQLTNGALQGYSATAVNGIRAGGTYFSLDGATNVDPYLVLGAVFPDPDATREFQVVTGTYGTQYVSAPGGAVNIVTRSGSNKFHGTVFEFLRNGYFNAENAILAQPDILKRNQFGGTVGGPIRKDKLFFFFSYQGTRIATQNPYQYEVPTAAERAGNFIACPAGAACSAANEFTINLAALPPVAGPNTENPVNANFFNYNGSGNALIPEANNTSRGNYFVFGLPFHSADEQYVGRVDYSLGSHRLFARYFSDRYTSPAVAQPTSAPYNVFDSAASSQQYWDSATLGDTWTPSATWVLNTRVSFVNAVQNSQAPSSDSFLNYPALGAQNYSVPNPPDLGITVIGSTVPPTSVSSMLTPRTTFQVSEDAVNVRGNHEISFGGDSRWAHFGLSNPSGQNGVIIYAGVYTSIVAGIAGLQIPDSSFADFYLGHPVEFIQGDGFFQSVHAVLPGFYAQDKWRATDRLTVTYGARWDPFIPYKPENNEISCFIPGEKSSVYPNGATGLVFPGDPGCSSTGGVSGKYDMVQPRIGLAYQVDSKGRTVIRSGYGLYQIQVPLAALGGFQSWPFTRQYIVANPFQSISNIWGSNGLTNPFASGYVGFGYKPASNVAFPTAPPNVAAFTPNFRPGYAQQFSLSLQQALGNNDSLEFAYVGSKGTHMAQTYNANLSGSGASPSAVYSSLGVISTEAPVGWSEYDSGQVTYRHRAALGLDLLSNFTWSKCFDNGSNPGSTGANIAGQIDIDLYNQAFSKGLCDFDQTYNFRNTIVWTSPKLTGRSKFLQEAFGSWVLSGNVILNSGQPFSVTYGTGTSTVQLRANYVPNEPLYAGGKLNYSAFTAPTGSEDGDTPRNGFRAAPFYEVDTALMKNFALTERFGLMFRAEAFNIINHPNYYDPLTLWSSANPTTFDEYQAAQDPRQLQFALKLTF